MFDVVVSIDDTIQRDGFIVIKPETTDRKIDDFGEGLKYYLGENQDLTYCVNLFDVDIFTSRTIANLIKFRNMHIGQKDVVLSLIMSEKGYMLLKTTGTGGVFDIYKSPEDFIACKLSN